MKKLRPLALMFSLLFSLQCDAKSDEEYGWQIANEYNNRDLGFGDFLADMEMILIDSKGNQSHRLLKTKTLEVENNEEGERRLLLFEKPRDVKGTIMLTVTRKLESDNQWIYLPAIKRVKRITSNNKTGPFMGSEFAYEDLGSVEVEKYSYKYLAEKPCMELQCFVVERYPKDKDSGYTKQIIWIDKEEYRLWKVEYFDRKNELLKTLSIKGYEQYRKKYWRAKSMLMENWLTGKKTILKWSDYKFNAGINSRDFESDQLARMQ